MGFKKFGEGQIIPEKDDKAEEWTDEDRLRLKAELMQDSPHDGECDCVRCETGRVGLE